MENIEEELNKIFSHNKYNKDLPSTDSEKTIGVQNDLNELFNINNVIWSADSIRDSKKYSVSDRQIYNVITYKNGYKEIYKEYTDYNNTIEITRCQYSPYNMSRIHKLHDEYRNCDNWHFGYEENYYDKVSHSNEQYNMSRIHKLHDEYRNCDNWHFGYEENYYDKVSHSNEQYYEQLRNNISEKIKQQRYNF